MSRTPQAGLVLFLLLGLSGCAGVPQRLTWSSPSADSSDTTDKPARSRFSWWRRPPAQAPTTDSTDLALAGRAIPAPADKLPVDVWPESRSEWLGRQFPRLSRLWNGKPTGSARDAVPDVRTDVGHVSARSRPAAGPAAGREDDEVRPVEASPDDDLTSGGGQAVPAPRERNVRAPLPPPLLISFRPAPSPESVGDVEVKSSNPEPRQASHASSEESDVASTAPELVSTPSFDGPMLLLLAPSFKAQTDPAAASQINAAPCPVLASSADPAQDVIVAQATAPPAIRTTTTSTQSPPLPPPAPAEQIVADKATLPADAPSSSEALRQEAQAASAPPAASVPGPVSVQTQQPAQTSGLPLVAQPAARIYASPPPVAPPQPRRGFLGLFFVEGRTEPVPSPQFPPATFPTSYHVHCPQPSQVLPAPQGDAPPPVATEAARKPCVLSGLLHKLMSCCRSCGGSAHHHAGSVPCCQGCTCHRTTDRPVSASPQANSAFPPSSSSPPGVSKVSAGAEPGNVAQIRKVVETAAPEGLDKSPQS